MDRQQDGNITEAELCQFWNALSGQQVANVGEISEQRLQGMVGNTEADLKALLLVDGPAIFANLEELWTYVQRRAREIQTYMYIIKRNPIVVTLFKGFYFNLYKSSTYNRI